MKNKVLVIFALFSLIVMLNNVVAAPKPQVLYAPSGLQIGVVVPEYHKQNTPWDFNVHVINGSNYMTNLTSVCFLHIYNGSGYHRVQRNLNFNNNLLEYDLLINKENFSELGVQNYIVGCNTTNKQAALATGQYEVTPNGVGLTTAISLYYMIIVAILIAVIFISIYLVFYVDSYGWKAGLFSIIFFSSFILIFVAYNFATNYMWDIPTVGTILYVFFIAMFPLTFVFIIFLVMYLLYNGTTNIEGTRLEKIGYSKEEANERTKRYGR